MTDDLAVLDVVSSAPEAEIIRGLLQTEGIPAVVRQTTVGAAMAGGLPGGGGMFEILVPEASLNRARRLIEERSG